MLANNQAVQRSTASGVSKWTINRPYPLTANVNTELARDQGDDSIALFVLAYSWRHVVLVVECLPVARFACVWFG